MSFSDQEMQEFKAEAMDLLETAEKSLLTLDQGGQFQSVFAVIFRAFHNLKGASGMMELTSLQAHTHELETILMRFKDSTSFTKEYINFFLGGIDAARSILNGQNVTFDFNIASSVAQETEQKIAIPVVQPAEDVVPTVAVTPEEKNAPESAPEIVMDPAVAEFVAECDEIIDRVSDVLQLVESNAHKKEDLEALYRDIHSLKGSSYLFSYNSLGDIAHAMESSLEGVRNGTHPTSEALLNSLFNCLKVIEAEILAIKTNTKCEQTELLIPQLTNDLNAAVTGQSNPTEGMQTMKQDSPTSVEVQATQPVQAKEPTKEPIPSNKDNESNGSIRVSVSLLDNLMTLMGEMVLVRNQVLQFSSKSEDLEFLNLSKRLNVVTSEIQGEMMKTRMQPIGNILSKFNRVVRDLSHELKKEISLNLFGAETELDKSLLESIKDPLTHIVRNSCDHGIETSDVRVQSGKPRNGTINIRSYHEGGQVVIEIADDGKGLHKEVLLKKALEKSLISQTQASSLSEKEIFNLIFAPGFSTAASVTNVSGRGVGMDVVRTNVERIGGSVELISVAGKGTTTKLKIPLTLAIVPALIVKCSGETFAIPQVKLEELVRVDSSSNESKIEFLHGSPVYRLRGNILPLVNLNKVLGLADTNVDLNAAKNIAVLNADHCSFGLLVDEVQDTADIVVKPINRLLKSLHVYSGATILGDGSIALILDVLGISKVAQIGHEQSKDESASKRDDDKKRLENQEFLIVKVNSPTKHAIVLNYVHRLEEFKREDIEYSGTQKVIRYGDSILPLLSTNLQLGYETSAAEKTKETIPVVVIQKAGLLYGLEVEEIVDTLSTDAPVDTAFVKQSGIFGNLNTPEELIVAIDPFELIGNAYPESVSKPAAISLVPQSVDHIPAQSKNLNILLVEDTVFFRRAIADVLKKAGHEITLAVDGKDAFEILEKNQAKFDLVVSDIEMPRMNGFELAKAIRANKNLSHLPMLAISSRADKGYTDQGLKSGFNIYLEKLKPNILLDAVASLTSSNRRSA